MSTREQFSSKTGFVMAAAGSAIGLGNIWSFPTQTASNGGAAFVLVYFILAFCLAYPALMAELIIGRHARANVVTALRSIATGPFTYRLASVVGFYGVITASLILSFYAIIAGWMLAYMLASLSDFLGCIQVSAWLTGFSLSRNLFVMAFFMALTMAIIARGVTSGIEKWSTLLMPILFILLVILIVYVLMQEGASKGLRMYLLPDLAGITPSLVVSAMGQAFFSLSLGVGTMLIYGSYLSEKESLPKLGAAVTLLDSGVAFVAGLLIIPAIYVAQHYGAEIFTATGDLIAGPDLIFQILPVLFDSMGGIGIVAAAAFFLLMTIASLTSSISMLEVPVSLMLEETAVGRMRATLIIGSIIFLISTVILFNFDALFDFVVTLTTEYSQPLLGVVMCLYVGWIWHRDNLLQEIKKGDQQIDSTLFWKIWPAYVRFFCPVLILAVFVQSVI
jgi:NSS family neurotransmitter:Na+ symporter